MTGVTVTYGSRAELCAQTILGAIDAGCQNVIVVFNGCTESVVNEVQTLTRRQSLSVTSVINPINLGSAGGYNLGLKTAIDREPDLIWLLDDDNCPEPGALAAAVQEWDTRVDVAVFCSRSGSPDHTKLQQGWPPSLVFPPSGSFMYFDIWQRISRLVRTRKAATCTPIDLGRSVQVPYGPYGGLLVTPALIRKAGLPDPSLFLYEDDTDYSYRLGLAKAQLVWCRDALVIDQDGKWTEKNGLSGLYGVAASDDRQRLYIATRNRSTFDLRRARTSGFLLARMSLNVVVYATMFTVSALRSGRRSNIPLFFGAVIDGFRRKQRPIMS